MHLLPADGVRGGLRGRPHARHLGDDLRHVIEQRRAGAVVLGVQAVNVELSEKNSRGDSAESVICLRRRPSVQPSFACRPEAGRAEEQAAGSGSLQRASDPSRQRLPKRVRRPSRIDLFRVAFHQIGGIEKTQLERFILPFRSVGGWRLSLAVKDTTAAKERGYGANRLSCAESSYLRFQRTPSLESSIRMPLASRSLRMASARAKLRVFLAWVRSATSASISASESDERSDEFRGGLVDAAFRFGPGQRGAGDGGVAVFKDSEDAIEEIENLQDLRGFSARRVPASAAEFAARTRSKMAARASAVFRSLASAAV